jgi:L-malate glycosyltransferase
MRKPSLHIIHISTARTWRGGEQQLAYLIKALDAQKLSQEVLCAAGSAFAEYCRNQAIKTTEFRKRSSIDLRAPVLLKQMSRRHQNTIIHCHDSHAHNIAWLSALVFGNRTPVVVHRRVDFPVKN